MSKPFRLCLLLFVFAFVFSCAREIKPPPKPAKIAVVLGAGAARGFAHIGVLKVLEANQIPVHMIVGTSAGSFVGSLYSHGFNAFQLQKLSFSLREDDIIDLTVPDNGFIKGEKLGKYINQMTGNTPLEKLRIPFYAVATNLQTGEEVVFGSGDTGTAVRASCAIPGIFRPVEISKKFYVDGGVSSPVAVDAAKRLGADVVIAVDISGEVDSAVPRGTIETIIQSVSIIYAKLAATQVTKADVAIRPKVGSLGGTDFTKRHEAVLEGEKATLAVLPQIREIVNKLKREGRL